MKFKMTKICVAAMVAIVSSSAFALTDAAVLDLVADSDNTGDGGVFIKSEGGGNPASYLYLYDAEGNGILDGTTKLGGTRLIVETGSTAINSATSINSTLSVTGVTATAGITNEGSLTQTGASTLVGTTNINASGSATTNIGTNGGATNIGSAASTNTILGFTNVTGVTTINTDGGADTTIGTLNGASVNTLQGAANSITATGANSFTGATNSLLATTGNNSITSTAGANAISAQTGNSITTATGNNAITATAGANAISAQTGNSITTATGNNALTATVGSNNLTAATSNNIQAPLNNIGTDRVSVNNVGTGTFQSTNNIGNTVAGTTVTSTAVNASQALAEGTANTKVISGASRLTARVDALNVATTGQVLLSNTAGTTVNANGKIVASGAADYVNPVAPTAAVTLTNGYGNTHGLVVTESQTTLSGGTESSSMTLTDRAATFSNAQNGNPITVTGVADGRADFDAINVRQFAGAIAAVAAQANIPALAAGQDRTFGMGVGNFMGKSALAMGMSMRGGANSVYKATVSSGLNNGMKKTVVGVGGAWGF